MFAYFSSKERKSGRFPLCVFLQWQMKVEFKSITSVWTEQRWENQANVCSCFLSVIRWFYGLRSRLSLIQHHVRSVPGSGQPSQPNPNYFIFHTSGPRLLENEQLKEKRKSKPAAKRAVCSSNKCQVNQRLITVLMVLVGLVFFL